VLLGIAAGMMLLAAGAAYAYFQTTDQSHPAAALAATLTAPAGLAANGSATPSSIPIKWTAPTGYTPAGYIVLRCTGSSCTPSSSPSVGGCSKLITSVVTTTSCLDSDTTLAAGTTYTYKVEAVLDNWVSPATASFTASTTAISKLVLTTQPAAGANIQAEGTGSFSVSVSIEDSNGAVDTNDNSDTITLSLGTNPTTGSVLSCTNTGGVAVTASGGVASFSGCAITLTGTGYKLTALSPTSPSLSAPTNANSFNIVAGTASQLAFTAQPSSGQNIQAAGTGTFSAAVTVEDQNGNPVTTDAGHSITLSLGSEGAGPGGGSLACTNTGGLTVTDSGGTANFTGCSITLAGTGYKLAASSSPSLTAPTNANSFNISAGAASRLTFTTQPASGASIQAKGTGSFSASVTVEDQNGNPTSDSGRSITLSLGSEGTGPGGGALACTNTGGLTVTDSGGTANFTGCSITLAGTGYKLAAAATGLSAPANANSFNIIAGAASQLTFTTQPLSGQNIEAAGSGSFPVTVAVEDQNGNPTSDSGRSITLSLGTNPTAGSVLACTNTGGLTVTDSGGTASFTGCSITLVGTGYKLAASSSPSLTAPSNATAFNIIGGAPAYIGFTDVVPFLSGMTPANCPVPAVGTHSTACTFSTVLGLVSYTAEVELFDQNGNPATNTSNVTVNLSAGGVSSVSVPSLSIASGSNTSTSSFMCTLGLGGLGVVTASTTVNSVLFSSTLTPQL
jgi:adhesin/invasin